MTDFLDFTLNSYIAEDLEVKKVEFLAYQSFTSIFKGHRVKVRPNVDHGIVEIYLPEKEIWINGNSIWNEQPLLHQNMLIRFLGLADSPILLSFELLDITNYLSYKSQFKHIYPRNVSSTYIQKLNDSIRLTQSTESSKSAAKQPLSESISQSATHIETKKETNSASSYIFPVLILVSLIIFLGIKMFKNGKITQCGKQ